MSKPEDEALTGLMPLNEKGMINLGKKRDSLHKALSDSGGLDP